MRDIADYIDPSIILLTETNVPNKENLSYFGDGDEADMVYQFSLPPLLLHALYNADSSYLSDWAESLSEIPGGCTFFNFTASHDGIGVRPLEGLVPKDEVLRLAGAMKTAGGHIGTKRNSDGSDSPYELNITYLDALKNTSAGEDEFQLQRFVASQSLMMSFKGVPAFYIHSLLGTPNYHEGVKETGVPRSINRRKWDIDELYSQFEGESMQRQILDELIRRIIIRKKVKAFHPDSPQVVIKESKELFIMCRGENQEVVVLANLTPNTIELPVEGKKYLEGKSLNILGDTCLSENQLILKPYQVSWLTYDEG
jgi:sucrose phosphorylase